MRVASLEAPSGQLELRVRRGDDVDDAIALRQVSPLHYYDAGTEGPDPPARRPHVIEGADGQAGQDLGLGHVGRDDLRELQERAS